jgi:hypothetical protein
MEMVINSRWSWEQMEMELEMSWPKSRGEAHTVVEKLGHGNRSNALHKRDVLHRSNFYRV